ncbi:MAG: helix-turn-helix domain-containing protein [Rubrobacteraceae bacterium]
MEKSIGARISLNLRRVRHERHVSLGELSRTSGVSKGTLTALESGTGNPTVDTLGALAEALGVSVEDLISPEAPQAQVLRSEAGAWVEGSAVGLRLVDRLLARGMVDVYEAAFTAGVRRESDGHAPGVLEHLLVTSGRLLAGPTTNVVELNVGDRITFAGDVPHVYEAVGGDARAVLLISYVRPPSPDQELQRELEHVLSEGDLAPAENQSRRIRDRRTNSSGSGS